MMYGSHFPVRLVVPLVAALAHAACSEAPTSASTGAPVASAAPNALVATPQAARPAAILVSPDQTVVVDLGEGRLTLGRFRSQIHVAPDPEKDEIIWFQVFDPESSGPRATFVVTVSTTALTQSRDGFVLTFTGVGELCLVPSGTCRPLDVVGTVRPGTTEGSLIYDIVVPVEGGEPIQLFSFEATGKLILPGAGPA